MASARNLTPRKSSYERAKTIEIETQSYLPYLEAGLRDIPTLRQVSSRYDWQLPNEDEQEEREDEEPKYDTITSSPERSIANVSERVLGRKVYPGESVTEVEWDLLVSYIKRYN